MHQKAKKSPIEKLNFTKQNKENFTFTKLKKLVLQNQIFSTVFLVL